MNKEQFTALGLTDEQAEKAATASADELKGFVPKTRFDEVNEAKKQAEKGITDRDKQIDELGKVAGVSEELKAQITKLQGENQTAKEEYETNLKDLTLTGAIKAALAGKVHDEGLAAGLIDKSKLVLDGDKVVGLDDQVKGLKESRAFLFKPDDNQQQQQQTPPGFKVGAPGNSTPPPGGGASLQDAIAAHFQSNQ